MCDDDTIRSLTNDNPVGVAQVAGFVLSPDSQQLIAYRWTANQQTEWDEQERQLKYTVPDVSVPFLHALILRAMVDQEPLRVYRLTEGQCHALGTFVVQQWVPPTVQLKSISPAPTSGPIVASPTVAEVLLYWGLDVGYDAIEYPVGTEHQYVPDATLYGVMGPDVIDWCGVCNRFGTNCLAYITSLYPPRHHFSAARNLAQHYRYPVLLIFGEPTSPDAPGALETNCALQVIAFQPGTGTSRRVHFARRNVPLGCDVQLCVGELGESE